MLHEDSLKGITPFEYPIATSSLENFMSLKGETRYHGFEEYQNPKQEADNSLADGKQEMKLNLLQDGKWEKHKTFKPGD